LGLRVLLAAVFITAGVGKLLDLQGSRRAVTDFGVPERAARVVGVLLPLAELAIGLALIFRPSARWAALAALILLSAFIVGIARALARGEEPDCHCFGQIHSAPAGPLTLARNALLAAFAVVVLAYGQGPALDAWVSARSTAELVAVAAGIWAFAATAYALSLASEVRRLKGNLSLAQQQAAQGIRSGIPVGTEAPAFALPDLHGRTVTLTALLDLGQPLLLVFMNPGCGPCATMLPRVQQWQETLSARLTIAVVSAGTAEQNALAGEEGLKHFLLQDHKEVADMYGAQVTPSAVFVSRQGKIASALGEGEQGIEPLMRLALRDGLGATLAASPA
jgi:uncharacterized membrane protein YphA (DoxX/SURF4 family)/peroxiredoxin